MPPSCGEQSAPPRPAPPRGLPVSPVGPAFPPPGCAPGRRDDRYRADPWGDREGGGSLRHRTGGGCGRNHGGDPGGVFLCRPGQGGASPRAVGGGEPPRGPEPPEAHHALSSGRGAFPPRGDPQRPDRGTVPGAGDERGGGSTHRGESVPRECPARGDLPSRGDPVPASPKLPRVLTLSGRISLYNTAHAPATLTP